MAALVGRLEELGEAGRLDGAGRVLAELEGELARVLTETENHLGQP